MNIIASLIITLFCSLFLGGCFGETPTGQLFQEAKVVSYTPRLYSAIPIQRQPGVGSCSPVACGTSSQKACATRLDNTVKMEVTPTSAVPAELQPRNVVVYISQQGVRVRWTCPLTFYPQTGLFVSQEFPGFSSCLENGGAGLKPGYAIVEADFFPQFARKVVGYRSVAKVPTATFFITRTFIYIFPYNEGLDPKIAHCP